MITVSEDDFMELYEGINPADYDVLISTENARGSPYEIITLPMTAENVEGLDYKASYLNYYVGNEVVLLTIYSDANDQTAIDILTKLYADREIVAIDATALYAYSGMIHCITQQ